MKKTLMLSGVLLLAVMLFVVLRALSASPQQTQPQQRFDTVLDRVAIAERLAQAIRFKTISLSQKHAPGPAFPAFLEWLQATYPTVFSTLSQQRFGEYTVLLRWQGQDSSQAPVMLSSHYDVVPVIAGTESQWSYPPFAGTVADEYIWGRGALDDKSAVIATLETLEHLLQSGFTPKRTVYIALTHDEEIGSPQGASGIAAYFKREGIMLDWTLDEGSFYLDGMVPGINKPVASISVAEKGFLTLELKAHGKGGHSSMPPKRTTAGLVAQAVSDVQNRPLPSGLSGVSAEMFDMLVQEMSFSARLIGSNRWLFDPMLEYYLQEVSFTAALLGTTTAPTMLRAGVKDNVLPIDASAIVNFRLHPRDSVASVVEHVQTAIADERVQVHVLKQQEPSRESDTRGAGYRLIARAAVASAEHALVIPGITVAGTDSKKYADIARDNYRFNPMQIGKADLAGFHGTDERISVDNMLRAIAFYQRLLKSLGD